MPQKEKNNGRVKKLATTIFLVVMTLLIAMPVFFYPQKAEAFLGINLSTTIGDIPRKIGDAINKAIRSSAALAYRNTLKAFLNKVAYDAAVYIASGGAGQKPMFETNLGTMLEKSADAAYGDFLDGLSKDIWGKSLCEPLTPTVKVKLDVWARQVNEPPKPAELKAACPISKMGSNLFGKAASTHEKLFEFSKNFNEGASEFGAFLKVESGAIQAAAQKKEMTWFTKLVQGEFNPLQTTVTGETKTPAALIQEVPKVTIKQSFEVYQQYTGEAIADAIGIFTNTLTSRLLKKIFEKGYNPSTGGGAGGLAGPASQGVAAAKIQFASLNQPDFNVSGSIDVVNQLVSCPPDPAYNNCIIDEKFKIAIEQKLTVREALDRGLLDSTKVFGFDNQGKEPSVQNGYPYRSMLILRKYRIIPVGWELAAQYIRDFAPSNNTLSQIVDLYEDKTSQFYHLIDPNWVLKAPEVYCKREGAGEQVVYENWVPTYNLDQPAEKQISAKQVQRQDYCADEQTCLFENEDGSCQKFGYCLEEKPTWRFQGDGCQAEYNSCQAFQKSDGTNVGYLKNTLNYNNCNSQNVGCQIYCTQQVNNLWNCGDGENIISLNAKAEQCSAKADGCSEFIRTKPSLGTNIIPNSSFEKYIGSMDDAQADAVDGWGSYEITGLAFQGQAGVELNNVHPQLISNPNIETGYPIASRTFNFSFFGKAISDASTTCNNNNSFILSGQGFGSDLSQTFSYYDAWTRYAGNVTFPADRDTSKIRIIIGNDSNCQAAVDGLQLEENTTTSDYKDYGSANAVYLNGTRSSCTQEQVGCEKYTNLTTGDFVPGTITNPATCNPNDPSSCDQCPAEFQGCKAFREMPITHVPQRAGQDLISFLPSTAKTCPASSVGCEEYTNLDEVAQGGEGREYYTSIRQCVKEDDQNQAAYYTWVGSSEFGYQLQKFILKRSNLDGAPCTNMNPENVAPSWPACNDSANPGDPNERASCGNDTCAANLCTNSGAACTTDQDCIDYELYHNPDCAQFYDTAGTIYYRLRSRVIYVSSDCRPYRNSIDGQDVCTNGVCEASGLSCGSSTDCQNHIYHMIPGQGLSCQAEYAGCRAYKGNAGNNVRNVISSDFEQGALTPWTAINVPAGLNPSTESIQVGGHSMLVYTAASTKVDTLISTGKSYIISFWAKADQNNTIVRGGFTTPDINFSGQAAVKAGEWNQYKLGPLFIDTNQNIGQNATLTIFSDNAFYIDNIILQEVIDNLYYVKGSYRECPGWENCDAYSDRDGNTHYLKSFSQLCPMDKVGCEALIDTKNSSSPFPQSFKINPERGDVNSDGKVDMDDATYLMNYLFKGGPPPYPLALGDVNGIGGISNGDVVYLLNYLRTPPGPAPVDYPGTNLTIPEDSFVFLVNDEAKYCASTEKGCMKLGIPSFNASNGVDSYQEGYFINNPDDYADILCNSGENKCAEYSSGSAKIYFKEPGSKICEYRKVVGQQQAGWYIVGSIKTSPDCPIVNGFCLGGSKEGQSCNSNSDCITVTGGICKSSSDITRQPTDGYAGLCPAEKSGCQEYRDPSEAAIEGASETQCKATLKANTYETMCITGPHANTTTGCDPSSPTICGSCVGGGSPGAACVRNSDCPGAGATCNAGSCGITNASCRSYYYLSQSLDTASCTGVVDQREGCRLFYDETAGGPVYDSDKTYSEVDRTRLAQSPQLCADSAQPSADCDSNLILKVRNDRECNKWLECSSSVRMKNTKGQIEDFCFEVSSCNKLSPEGYCIGNKVCSAGDRENLSCQADTDCPPAATCVDMDSQPGNLTYQSPDDIDKLANLSGLSKAGINWGCSNDRQRVCRSDADCVAPGTCEVIEGYYPIRAMSQLGQAVTDQDLITNGDMGDSNLNSSYNTSGNGSWEGKDASVDIQEEGANGGQENKKLDENNILMVDPNSNAVDQGVAYSLTTSRPTSGLEYVVSFKAKYDGAPTADDKITVEIYSKLGTAENRSIFGEVQPSTSWQNFVLEKLNVNILTGSTEVKLRLLQTAPSGRIPTGITFYLDDVSIKPALAVNVVPHCQGGSDNGKYCDPTNNTCSAPGICYQDTKVSRSCRLYPRGDSLYCTYDDTNGATYKGWYGYCLEADPKNPDQCLSWWPVDIIAGESNVFGAGQQAGYNERKPLYMCLEAKGNYNRSISCSNCQGVTPSSYKITIDGPYYGYGFFSCSGGDNWCQPVGFPWNGNCTQYYTPANFNSNQTNIKEYDIERIQMRWPYHDDQWDSINPSITFGKVYNGIEETGFCQTACNTYKYERVTNQNIVGSPANDIIWRFWPLGNCHSDQGYQCVWLDIIFDGETGNLAQIRDAAEDATGSIDECGGFVLDFYLREPCTKVVQVVEAGSGNKAWSGRVRVGSSYPTGVGNYPANYPFTADLQPFGGSAEPEDNKCPGVSRNDPTTWDTRCETPDEGGRQPIYVEKPAEQARAGQPYSLANPLTSAPGTMCLGGGSKEGQTCAKAEDCKDINTGAQGTCVGFQMPAGGIVAGPNSWNNGVASLKRIFADVYRAWDYVNGQYQLAPSLISGTADRWQNTYQSMPVCPSSGRPTSVNLLTNEDYCGIRPTVSNIKVISRGQVKTSGDITISPRETIQLTFTSSVDREQLPLRIIGINKIGPASPGAWDKKPWNLAPKSDQSDPHWYSISYDAGDCPAGCTPRIQVMDNWDWCSGSINAISNRFDSCGSYDEFAGRIFVE